MRAWLAAVGQKDWVVLVGQAADQARQADLAQWRWERALLVA